MATVSHTSARTFDRRTITWTGIATGDTINPFIMDVPGSLAAIQATGTFGSATVTLSGSLDGTTYFSLSDVTGTAISLTANGYAELSTAALYIKPAITGGTGDSVTVVMVVRTNDAL